MYQLLLKVQPESRVVLVTRPAELPDLLLTSFNRFAQFRFKFVQELIQPVEGFCLLQYIPFRPRPDPSKRILKWNRSLKASLKPFQNPGILKSLRPYLMRNLGPTLMKTWAGILNLIR